MTNVKPPLKTGGAEALMSMVAGDIGKKAQAFANEGDGADDFAAWALESGLVKEEATEREFVEQTTDDLVERKAEAAEDHDVEVEDSADDNSVAEADKVLFGDDDKALIARLDAAYAPPQEDARTKGLHALYSELQFVKGQLAGRGTTQQQQQAQKVAPTGDPDVDQVLMEKGLLADPLESVVNSRFQQLQEELASIKRQAEDERAGREMGQRLLAEAEQVSKVFDGLTARGIAEQAVRSGRSPVDVARDFYQGNGWLGQDGLPTRRFKQTGAPMPQAGRGQSSAGRGSAAAKTGQGDVWRPTNDIDARRKALQDL